jgi:hypothetical protein
VKMRNWKSLFGIGSDDDIGPHVTYRTKNILNYLGAFESFKNTAP